MTVTANCQQHICSLQDRSQVVEQRCLLPDEATLLGTGRRDTVGA
jgi:hypothetical protein